MLEAIAIVCAEPCVLTQADLDIFVACSTDQSVTIRKQAITSLTHLLQAHGNETLVQDAWLQAVPAALMDVEATMQEKAVEFMNAVLLEPAASKNSADRYCWCPRQSLVLSLSVCVYSTNQS